MQMQNESFSRVGSKHQHKRCQNHITDSKVTAIWLNESILPVEGVHQEGSAPASAPAPANHREWAFTPIQMFFL